MFGNFNLINYFIFTNLLKLIILFLQIYSNLSLCLANLLKLNILFLQIY